MTLRILYTKLVNLFCIFVFMLFIQHPTKVLAEENFQILFDRDFIENNQGDFLNYPNKFFKQVSNDSNALINRANVMESLDWDESELVFAKASSSDNILAIAKSSQALAVYQTGDLDKAELELRETIRKYPMVADARAGLSALLWKKGMIGEAESNWTAAVGLDSRYLDRDWLLHVRRWPPQPTNDLFSFLALELS